MDQGKAVYNVQKAAYDIAHGIPSASSAPVVAPVVRPTPSSLGSSTEATRPQAAVAPAETSPSAEHESEDSTSSDSSDSAESESDSSEEEEEQAPAAKKHKGLPPAVVASDIRKKK